MRITLAYPYEGHKPDDTIEIPDAEGQTLIFDGWARPADDEPAASTDAPKGARKEGPA